MVTSPPFSSFDNPAGGLESDCLQRTSWGSFFVEQLKKVEPAEIIEVTQKWRWNKSVFVANWLMCIDGK